MYNSGIITRNSYNQNRFVIVNKKTIPSYNIPEQVTLDVMMIILDEHI
jgi:hypothetical protein